MKRANLKKITSCAYDSIYITFLRWQMCSNGEKIRQKLSRVWLKRVSLRKFLGSDSISWLWWYLHDSIYIIKFHSTTYHNTHHIYHTHSTNTCTHLLYTPHTDTTAQTYAQTYLSTCNNWWILERPVINSCVTVSVSWLKCTMVK